MTREEAISLSLKTYYTGVECKHGHLCERFVSSRGCVRCGAERRAKKWFETHTPRRKGVDPQKTAARRVKYRSVHRVELKEREAAYRAANREKNLARLAKWRRENPEKVKAVEANSRTKGALGGKCTSEEIKKIERLQNSKCAYCQYDLTGGYELDHILPVRLGGTSDRKNIQLLCSRCNKRKHFKHPLVFARELGLLI